MVYYKQVLKIHCPSGFYARRLKVKITGSYWLAKTTVEKGLILSDKTNQLFIVIRTKLFFSMLLGVEHHECLEYENVLIFNISFIISFLLLAGA